MLFIGFSTTSFQFFKRADFSANSLQAYQVCISEFQQHKLTYLMAKCKYEDVTTSFRQTLQDET